MERALVNGDLVSALVSGAVPNSIAIPSAFIGLPQTRLRYVGGQILDAAGIGVFYISPDGVKHALQADAAWQRIACKFDDVLVQTGGTWSVRSPVAALQQAQAEACARVDASAERLRNMVVTPGAGQAMVYREKLDQARGAIADPAPSTTVYPLLAASVGIEGASVAEVAKLVVDVYQKWIVLAAAIETVRLKAKAQINAATDELAVAGIVAALAWPAVG